MTTRTCIVCKRELDKKHTLTSMVISFYDWVNRFQRSDYGPLCFPCSAELSSTGRIALDTPGKGRSYAVRVENTQKAEENGNS